MRRRGKYNNNDVKRDERKETKMVGGEEKKSAFGLLAAAHGQCVSSLFGKRFGAEWQCIIEQLSSLFLLGAPLRLARRGRNTPENR